MEPKDMRLERSFETLPLHFMDDATESQGSEESHLPKVMEPGLKDSARDLISIRSSIQPVFTSQALAKLGAGESLPITNKRGPCSHKGVQWVINTAITWLRHYSP